MKSGPEDDRKPPEKTTIQKNREESCDRFKFHEDF